MQWRYIIYIYNFYVIYVQYINVCYTLSANVPTSFDKISKF